VLRAAEAAAWAVFLATLAVFLAAFFISDRASLLIDVVLRELASDAPRFDADLSFRFARCISSTFKDKKQCRRRLFPIGKNRTASDPAAALFA
jgi:hypothetical protein